MNNYALTNSIADSTATPDVAPRRTDTLPHSTVETSPWFQREPWLAVSMSAFLPIFAAIFAPQPWNVPLAVVAGLMIAASMLMLVRQLRQLRVREEEEQTLHRTAYARNR